MALLRDFGVGCHDLSPQNSAAIFPVQTCHPPGTRPKARIHVRKHVEMNISTTVIGVGRVDAGEFYGIALR